MKSLGPGLCLVAALACAADGHAEQRFETHGVVAGEGYYQNALVCIDANHNARCDGREASTHTDGAGRFSVDGRGPVVVEIVAGITRLVDPVSGARTPVADSLTLRGSGRDGAVVSAVGTELQAMLDAGENSAVARLAARVGVGVDQLLDDPNTESDAAARSALLNEVHLASLRIADAVADTRRGGDRVEALRNRLALDDIRNIVVIYAENRSFDNLFGFFPGANGLRSRAAHSIKQVDRDGATLFANLPPAWNGLTAAGQTPVVTQAETTGVWPNAPFQIDSPDAQSLYGYSPVANSVITRDLYHRFFENAMQIDGGKNDQYVAWADSGGLVMGYFDGSQTRLWDLAKKYALADNFFQAAYGGSFLNHQYLVCACVPTVSATFVSNNKPSINVLGAAVNGVPRLAANATQAPSALTGPTSLKTGNVAPLDYFGAGDGYRAVNTMQPAYQPSGNAPADAADALYADPSKGNTLEPQTQTHIGDLLGAKGVSWAWYAGGWAAAVADPWDGTGATATTTTIYKTNASNTSDSTYVDFQAHHQPFNYFAEFDPVAHADARRDHLKDRADLLNDIAEGTLPAVTFYKPVGFQNQHPGYANLTDGDAEIADVIDALQHSPQWRHMLVVVTYDEFGGQFDHVAPPKGDLVGPGTRIPAIIVSPYARRGYVDHTQYDTASILRFITHRYSLRPLPGLEARDAALLGNGEVRMGYLGGALDFIGATRYGFGD